MIEGLDLETVKPEDFGRALRGFGVNLLVRDVRNQAARLSAVFGMTAHRISDDFAILLYGPQVFQLHSDGTYHANPLQSLLPEQPPRGAGLELRLFGTDPDEAATRAEAHGFHVLQPPNDKPHGLREAYLLCPDGYAWVPSRPLD